MVGVLGFLDAYSSAWIVSGFAVLGALSIAGFAVAYRSGQFEGGDVIDGQEDTVFPSRLLMVALVGFALAYLFSTMAPPLDGDTLHTYLDVPRQFLDEGGIVELPYELLSTVPLNVQMLSVLSLELAGGELAQMLAGFGMAIGGSGVVFILGRRHFSSEVGLVAAVIFLSMNVVQSLVPTTKSNLGWAFFDLLAIYAASEWAFSVGKRQARWLIVAGLFSGLAIGAMYSGATTAVVLGIGVLYLSRHAGWRQIFKVTLLYGVPAVLLASPWLIRNWLDIGNPVFPIANSLFDLDDVDFLNYRDGRPLGVITAPWAMATGFIAGKFSQPLGPLILVGLPGLLLVRPLRFQIKVGLAVAAAGYLLWYLGIERPRNLLTVLGVASVLSAYAYVELGRRSEWIRKAVIVAAAVFLVVNLGLYGRVYALNLKYQNYIVGFESRDAFLTRVLPIGETLPTKPVLDHIARLPAGAVVVGMYLGNGYYSPRPFIDSRMVDGIFSRDTASDGDDLVRQWRAVDATHIFANYAFLDRGEWLSDLPLFLDAVFQSKCLTVVTSDGDQVLYELTCAGG
jgi:hypothetical protein